MIKLDATERTDPVWTAWRLECEAKQAAFNTTSEAFDPSQQKEKDRPKASADVYAKLKEDHYAADRAPFWGKCAYCELRIRTNQPGDVEHFRPKGRVTDRTTNNKLETRDGKRPHPGYYWLAYDWHNLLLACASCNRPNKRSDDGRRIGKWDHFPLEDESNRAEVPGDEVHEQPLLINPLIEDPANHLGITREGVMFALGASVRGRACIELLGLNERDLPDERARAYEEAYRMFVDLVMARLDDNADKITRLEARLEEIRRGSRPHAIATRLAIRDAQRRLAGLG